MEYPKYYQIIYKDGKFIAYNSRNDPSELDLTEDQLVPVGTPKIVLGGHGDLGYFVQRLHPKVQDQGKTANAFMSESLEDRVWLIRFYEVPTTPTEKETAKCQK